MSAPENILRQRLAAVTKERDGAAEWRRINDAAISVAAFANTPESAKKQRIDRNHLYWSAAYGDVCTAVDREIALIAERDQLRAELAKIRGEG